MLCPPGQIMTTNLLHVIQVQEDANNRNPHKIAGVA